MLKYCGYFTSILTFFYYCFFSTFLHTIILCQVFRGNTNYLQTVVWFMVSFNYFYFILIVFFLHIVIRLQVTNNITIFSKLSYCQVTILNTNNSCIVYMVSNKYSNIFI